MAEVLKNNAVTTLNGSITSGSATLSVLSAALFPGTGNFRIAVDSELMLVTGVSGTTFTVTRGLEATTAALHSAGAAVVCVLTAGSVAQYVSENAGSTGALLAANNLSDVQSASTSRTNLGLGSLATQSGTFSGTSSGTNTGDQTNISGNAATATLAGTVITNANLTGPITSSGNATAIASQTGTGTKFVVDTSPTLVTPVLGVATATSINGNTFTTGTGTLTLSTFTLTVAGTASVSGTNTGDQINISGNAATVTTNANLTGNVTSVGNATTIAAGVVTLAMQANMATSSLIYRKTAGSGAPEVNTLATLKTDLGLTGTNSGDQTTSNSDSTITVATGTTNPVVSLNLTNANTWTALQTLKISDSATATVTNVLTLTHDTSGTAAANFGTGLKFQGQDSTTADQDLASVQAIWTTATHASAASQLNFQTRTAAGLLATTMSLDGTGVVTLKGIQGSSGTLHITPSTNTNVDVATTLGIFTVSGTGGALIFGPLGLPAANAFTWSNSSNPSTTIDTSFSRLSAGLVAVGTGANGSFAGSVKLTNITQASGGTLTLGNNAATSLTPGVLAASTNASIVITDQTGQAYRIPCII